MNLNGYMNSPVGFGVYGNTYRPEISKNVPWVTPSRFSSYGYFGTVWSQTKGIVLGLGAGILTGLAVGTLKKDLVEHPLLKATIAPVAASVTTLVIYGLVS